MSRITCIELGEIERLRRDRSLLLTGIVIGNFLKLDYQWLAEPCRSNGISSSFWLFFGFFM